ncbi:MAG: alpha/beta hydrolase [Syntrophaceae bacterium]
MKYSVLFFVAVFAVSCSTLTPEPGMDKELFPVCVQSGCVPVNGAGIHYEIYGDGDPLILLHGGYSDVHAWRYQIPELSKYFRVIAVDSRGHGASTFDDQPFTYELFTTDIVGLMNYLKIDKADLVGWSDGAVVALHMGLYHPQRIKRVVLIGASVQYDNSLTPFDQWIVSHGVLFKLYADMELSTDFKRRNPHPEAWPEFRDRVYAMWCSACYLPVKQGEDCMRQLSRVTAPTLMLVGEDDMIRREHTEAIHRAIPSSRLITIKDADHFVAMQKPSEVNKAILDFLR